MESVIQNLRERKEAQGQRCVEIRAALGRHEDQFNKLKADLEILLLTHPQHRNEREKQLYERQQQEHLVHASNE